MTTIEKMVWHKTSERLPTMKIGEQVNVLIWSPEWATWLKGMFTFWRDEPPEWALYDQQHDRYEEMDQLLPEYWCAPTLPNTANGWHILKKGETIEHGDEYDASANGWKDDAVWKPVPAHMIGQGASDPQYPAHTLYRRRLP